MFGTSMTHRTTKHRLTPILCGFLIATLAGCTFLLPTGKKTTASACSSFEECTKIFGSIKPYETTVAELAKLGIDPRTTANVELLNYSDIIDRFNYSMEHEEAYPQGVRECVQVMETCRGYDMVVSHIEENRTGNTLLDLLQFKRKTDITGWIFRLLVVIKGDMVVYKLMGGTPMVDKTDTKVKPLGPLQESIGGLRPGF